MMAILRPFRLLLHQVHFNPCTRRHPILPLHPRLRPRPLLKHPKITLLHMTDQLLPRPLRRHPLRRRHQLPLRRLHQLPLPLKLAATVKISLGACTYFQVFSFILYHSSCLRSATWFLQHNTAGACGQVHSDSDLICAIGEYPLKAYYNETHSCQRSGPVWQFWWCFSSLREAGADHRGG